ncbi:hypothetical protein ACJA88_003603 [Fusarium oxysporum]
MTSTSAISLVNRVGHDPSKPTVIRLYGLPATGKSTVLEGLRNKLGETEFAFFDGSDVISYLVHGGLKAFQKLEEPEKKKWRAEAITHIKNEAAASGKIAVVTGHFLFDMTGLRAENWVLWQTLEVTILRDLCRQHKILFTTVQNPALENVLPLVQHFRELAPAGSNLAQVKKRLGEIIALHDSKEIQTFLVFGGDRALSAEDGGRLLLDELEQNGTGLKDSAMRDFFMIGGGRFSDGYFVTPGVKAAVVSHLRDVHDLNVWAFGDSPLDIPMLWEADQAVVVVGDEKKRSTTMDAALATAIQDGHLRARQVLLPSTSSPRLDNNSLPVVSFDDGDFVKSIVDPRPELRPLKKYDATNKAASNILMSPMRSAAVSGPMLRAANANVGRYLATEYVSKLIGLEEFTISHVQGHQTTGHRLRNEAKTSIIAFMRGGEPMAFGISDVFPQAMFVHASSADDVKKHHVQGQLNVILVDSVINSGKSVIELIKRVVRLEPNISITVVAGVVQTEAIAEGHLFAKVMRRHGAGLVALRISENKFTGTKTTDTGNRLFNTTRLA